LVILVLENQRYRWLACFYLQADTLAGAC